MFNAYLNGKGKAGNKKKFVLFSDHTPALPKSLLAHLKAEGQLRIERQGGLGK